MLFRTKNLMKAYGDRKVLDIPDLVFKKGIIYSLLGPNGSGKTTLLEILGLLIPATTGTIHYNEKKIEYDEKVSNSNLPYLRREIIMVHQNPILFTTTVFKNIEFGLKVRNISKKNRGEMIEDALELVGMQGFMDAEAQKLSGGETQRVAIARALACSPKVIFFDEPTSNVDVENQTAIERIIKEINLKKGISIIFTTHNLFQASRLAQDVISLYEGKIVESIFENIFNGDIHQGENGIRICKIQESISIKVKTDILGNRKLSINPSKIRIHDEDDKTEDDENIFQGKLIQLSDELDHFRAVVDIGIPLNILISKDEPKNKKQLIIGEVVKITCPSDSIQIF